MYLISSQNKNFFTLLTWTSKLLLNHGILNMGLKNVIICDELLKFSDLKKLNVCQR